jgi:hypothetical protein
MIILSTFNNHPKRELPFSGTLKIKHTIFRWTAISLTMQVHLSLSISVRVCAGFNQLT